MIQTRGFLCFEKPRDSKDRFFSGILQKWILSAFVNTLLSILKLGTRANTSVCYTLKWDRLEMMVETQCCQPHSLGGARSQVPAAVIHLTDAPSRLSVAERRLPFLHTLLFQAWIRGCWTSLTKHRSALSGLNRGSWLHNSVWISRLSGLSTDVLITDKWHKLESVN